MLIVSDVAAPNRSAQDLDHDYVFVGGLHRSGTSLTAQLLASREGSTGLADTGHAEDEGHYLHTVTRSAHAYGGPGRFAFDDQCQLGPSARPEVDRRRLLAAWGPYWEDQNARMRVEKSPQNLTQTRWLQSVIPQARFVIVTRHPAAAAIATMKWTRRGPAKLRRVRLASQMQSLMNHWVIAHQRFASDYPELDNVEIVRLCEVLDTTALGPLSSWLDIETPTAPAQVARPYDAQWKQWRSSEDGALAAKTWLPAIAEAIAPWGYSLDDQLI